MKSKKSVSAVILAGGFGTRLSPLTDTKPKPLVTVLDTPVLETILKSVERISPVSITVSTHCKSEMVERAVNEFCPRAACKREGVPLGTAGAVKYCHDEKADAVLVVSGDGVFDLDLQRIIDFHFENGNDVTVAGFRKDDPTEYGVIECDGDKTIVSFCEKPPWKRVRSDLVNTGIYVLSSEIVGEIPDNIRYDFSKNLFPRLLKQGRRMKVFEIQGYWCDIGTLDEYFECNRLAALGSIGSISCVGEDEKSLRDRGIHAENGCYVSKGVRIGKNVRMSDASVVCKDVHIGNNCDFSSCIVGSGCRIGNGCSISRAIIGENVCIGENCIIPEGCVIGGGCRISDGSVLRKNTRLAPRKCIFEEDNKMSLFSVGSNMFVDDGVCCFDLPSAREEIMCLARSVAVCFAKQESSGACVSVVCDCNAGFLKGAFISGLLSENAYVFDCGEGSEALCAYASSRFDSAAFVHIKLCGSRAYVTVMSDNGMPIDGENERKISKIYSLMREGGNEEHMDFSGELVFVPMEKMYKASVMSFAERILGTSELGEIRVCIINKSETDLMLSWLLERLGATVCESSDKETVSITVSPDGQGIGVRYANTVLDRNHISAIILKNKELLGIENVCVSPDAPSVLLRLAKACAEPVSFPEGFVLKDAVLSALSLLAVSAKRKMNVKELCGELSPFEIYTDEYLGEVNRGAVAERLSRLYHDSGKSSGDGIRLSLADGNVTVIPNRAKGFKIITESVSMEAARELSAKIGEIIKGKE